MEPVFWLMRLGAQNAMPKNWLLRVNELNSFLNWLSQYYKCPYTREKGGRRWVGYSFTKKF